MTKYYLEVMREGVSICLDTDVQYHHRFNVGDVIPIHMYSDKGPKVIFGGRVEYDAEFTLDWNKAIYNKHYVKGVRLTVATCISKGYMVDITKNVHRDEKLKSLGI